MSDDGRLPDTLFVQVDGGPENANKLVLAVLSYLVAKRVGGVQKIGLTRLPVGHTHEDVDAIFGRISQFIMRLHLLTPQMYERAIKTVLGKGDLDVEVVDLCIIPNYAAFFSACIHKSFGCAYKGENAKLQFTMEAVDVDPLKHPVGVKLTCRRFTQDFYPELIIDDNSPLGITVQVTR